MLTPINEVAAAARQMQEQGNHQQAALLWRQCMTTAPAHRDRRRWMASCAKSLFSCGRYARAFAMARRLARLFPERPDGLACLAQFYQKAGAHDRAVPVWLDLIARFPEAEDRRWWLPAAAFSLIDMGDYEAAERLCAEVIAAFPSSTAGYNAQAAVWERRFAWERALDSITRGLEQCREDERAGFIVSKARILAEMGKVSDSAEVLREELARSPDNIRLLAASAELAKAQGPTAEALDLWRRCLATHPDAPEACRGMASMLRSIGDTAGARDLLADACARFPQQAALQQALAEACAQYRDMEGARRAWEEACHLSPLSIYRLWGQCAFLGACGARDEAEALLARRRATGRVLWRGRYEYAKAARELTEALACLSELRAASPSDAVLAYAEAEIRSWRQDAGDLERAAEVLRSLLAASPSGVRVKALLARVMVLLDDPGAAEALVEDLPAEEQRRTVAEARLWEVAQRDDWGAAGGYWRALEDRFFLPALHLPAADLRLAAGRFTPPAQGGILAISIVRNELPRLEGFLNHHRRLGVDGFLIVDNASQDGTADYLAAQHDVRLYTTEESFSQSQFGMRWLNQVIDMHAKGWVLYADADERLVFPGSERRSLAQLTGHLAAHGEQVVPGVMLDMFPGAGGQDWFDPPILRPSMNCPFVEAAGGARRRLFGTTVMLSKAPLINAAAGVRYLGSHHTTPAPVSRVTAALLHHHLDYLFDPRHVARMADEASRAEHSDHAVDRRRTLAMAKGLRQEDLRGPSSLAYSGTAQLLELGLIKTCKSFEDAAGPGT